MPFKCLALLQNKFNNRNSLNMRTDFYNGIGIPNKKEYPQFISERGKITYYFFDEKSLPVIKEMVKDTPLIGYPNNFIIGHEKNGQICFFWG